MTKSTAVLGMGARKQVRKLCGFGDLATKKNHGATNAQELMRVDCSQPVHIPDTCTMSKDRSLGWITGLMDMAEKMCDPHEPY